MTSSRPYFDAAARQLGAAGVAPAALPSSRYVLLHSLIILNE